MPVDAADRPAQRAGVRVREARPGDARRTALLHAALLPHGFFAQLGAPFLAQYHRAFRLSEHAVSLVAVDQDDVVVGFLVGVLRPVAHGRQVLRVAGLRLALVGLARLLLQPRLLVLFLRTRLLRYVRGVSRRLRPAPAAAAGPRSAVLQHVAVDPARRLGGAGRLLVREFERRAAAAGVEQVLLLTAPDQAGAPQFYARLGYEAQGSVRGADGDLWLRFRRRTSTSR